VFTSDWHPVTVALVGFAVVVAGLSIRIAALGIIPANRKPATGMAWLLAVLLSPLPARRRFAACRGSAPSRWLSLDTDATYGGRPSTSAAAGAFRAAAWMR